MRPCLALPLLLALAACGASPPAGPPPVEAARAAPLRLVLNEVLARRGGGLRRLAWEGSGRGCGRSVLDDPAAAQRLMAATFSEGPRGVAMPVFACDAGSGFR